MLLNFCRNKSASSRECQQRGIWTSLATDARSGQTTIIEALILHQEGQTRNHPPKKNPRVKDSIFMVAYLIGRLIP